MANAPQAVPKRRWIRWWVWPILILAALILAFPTLLGSRWVYQPLVNRLAIEGFRLQIGSANIGWFSRLQLTDIRLEQTDAPKSDAGKPARKLHLLEIDGVESNRTLLGYLLGGRDLGNLRIVRPKLDIELLENTSNLEKLVKALPGNKLDAEAKKKTFPRIDLQVEIDGLSVEVSGAERDASLLVVPPLSTTIEYRARDGESRVVVTPSKVLDSVKITPELVRLGLGRAIPLLAKSAWFDGSVSLVTEKIEIPLEHPEASQGRAVLTLHQVRTGPSEPVLLNVLDMIAKFRGKEPVHELVFIDGSKVEIAARDGFIEHQGVQIGLPKIEPRLQLTSAGKVGIVDRTLAVQLGIPVPLEMLARRESVQQLGVPQIELPIRGTIDAPQVDWTALRGDSADVLSLIAAALGDEAPGTAAAIDALGAVADGQADQAIGAAVDVLKELRRLRSERRTRNAEAGNEAAPDTQGEPPANQRGPARRPLRDALKGILGGQGQ